MNSVERLWNPTRDAPERRHEEQGRHGRREQNQGFDQLLDQTLGATASSLQEASAWSPSTHSPEVRRTHADGVWSQVASRYDVLHLSVHDLAQLSLTLFEAGVISTLDHLILSASPEDLDLPWGSPLLTAPDAAGRVNWIEEIIARRAMAERYHHSKSVAEYDRLLDCLQRICALAGQSVLGTA